MHAKKSVLLSAAVSALCLTGCPETSGPSTSTPTAAPVSSDKHACRGQNDCKGKGGCGASAGKNECKGKGECGGKGGCSAKK